MVAVIICGILEGFEKKYRCPYCGYESDDIDHFATSMCWDCVYENTEDESVDE